MQVLQAQVFDILGEQVTVEEASLYGLMGPERDAAIDALSSGREFPFVIIGDRLACAGGLDAAEIAEVIRHKRSG